ncbi:MAG: pilus assembly protein [Burkholderiales bacterium]|nr:pilus assembly protein [Burkholderiales bacterium]
MVEFVVVGPLLLFVLLGLLQYGLLFLAKSQLNYATFEAARAGTVAQAASGRGGRARQPRPSRAG